MGSGEPQAASVCSSSYGLNGLNEDNFIKFLQAFKICCSMTC